MKSNPRTVTEGVFILNGQGNICVTSPGVNKLFGYRNDELLGLSFAKLVPEWKLSSPSRKQVTSIIHKGVLMNALKKSGKEIGVKVKSQPFNGDLESFFALSISAVPANSRKATKQKEQSPFIFLILDKLINVSLINAHGCELLDSTEENLKGLNWIDDFLPKESIVQVKAAFEQASTAGIATYECPVLTLGGDRHTIVWTTSAIYDSAGLPIGTLNTGVESGKNMDREIDLHHLDRVEKLNEHLALKVKKQNQELLLSLAKIEATNKHLQLQIQKRKETGRNLIKIQRLYDTVVHNFPDGVIGVLNRSMEYVLIDGKDLNVIDLPALGLSPQKVSERPESPQAEDTLMKIKKAFDGEKVSFEVQANERFYSISAVPLADEQNSINEILCVFKNVTDRKHMEDGLLKALEQERELGELRSRFVTMACHEFKTPLATILSSNFLLANYAGENSQENKLVHTNRIKRSVNNLTMILNEFLSLEKLEENQVQIVSSKINISKYIPSLIAEVDPIKQKGQIVTYLHTGEKKSVSIDPHLLWSIVTNLISNALKYSKAGGKIGVISIIKDDMTTITVRDYGIGIPENDQKHIFELFYRASNATNIKGTGLGLHIVEKNVKLLNGTISFTSQLNVGTEFKVTLPSGPSQG